jgi:hypothetical protein
MTLKTANPSFFDHLRSIPKCAEVDFSRDRQAFLLLPLATRRKILAAQAKKLTAHYRTDPETKAWLELHEPVRDAN